MKKRLPSLLLILSMMLSLAACGQSAVNQDEEAQAAATTTPDAEASLVEEEEPAPAFLDSMPESMDFEGLLVNFLVCEGANGNISELSIKAEEDTGEVVDSAVFSRNVVVEDRLNVKIDVAEVTTDSGTITSKTKSQVAAGTEDFKVVSGYQYYNITLASDGYVYNLNNAERFPYNDFTREYWGVNYINNMSYNGAFFFCTGDMALRYTGGMYVTFVNTTMWADYYPNLSIYDYVDEGTWTLDRMAELASGVYVDKNGDGKKDVNDDFGLTLIPNDVVDGMAAGAMITFSEFNSDGIPVLTLNNERTYDFYDKMYNIFANNPGYMTISTDDSVTTMPRYAEGGILMHCNKLYQAPIYLREMEDNYTVIPLPKLNEEQDHYNTRIHDSCSIYAVPLSIQNTEAVGATLEAMASEAMRLVTPAYYEVALKVKYTRDSDSSRMIDLVHENVSCDFACCYSNCISNINHIFRSPLESLNANIASTIERSGKAWNKALERLLTNLEKYSEN